jgi:hypothetical protein
MTKSYYEYNYDDKWKINYIDKSNFTCLEFRGAQYLGIKKIKFSDFKLYHIKNNFIIDDKGKKLDLNLHFVDAYSEIYRNIKPLKYWPFIRYEDQCTQCFEDCTMDLFYYNNNRNRTCLNCYKKKQRDRYQEIKKTKLLLSIMNKGR